jgi:TP901 family phage tail tape measure protein
MAGIKIPISYEYSPESLNEMQKQFNDLAKGAQLGPSFDAEINKINAKFKSVGDELKKQLASGVIDVEKLGLTDLEKDIEKFAKNVAFVLNEALDDTEIEKLTKQVTALGDEMIAKQKEIKELQKQRNDLDADRDAFKAKYGLAKMPPSDALDAERKLAVAQQQLADSGKGGSEELKKKVAMLKEMIALIERERQSKGSYYTEELNKVKESAKIAKESLSFMTTSGLGSQGGKNYSPVVYQREEARVASKEENIKLVEAVAEGRLDEAAVIYNKIKLDIQKITEMEAEKLRLEKESLEAKKQSDKILKDNLRFYKEAEKAQSDAVRMQIDARKREEEFLKLRARHEGKHTIHNSMTAFGRTQFYKDGKPTQGLTPEENQVPINLREAESSIELVQAKIKESLKSGNEEQAKALKDHLKVLKDYRNSYVEILTKLGLDINQSFTKEINIQKEIDTLQRLAKQKYSSSGRSKEKYGLEVRKASDFSMESINKNNAAENLGIEIAALKEKEALLESIKNIQSKITTDQFAAREAFKGKFGQDMPTEDLGQAQGMLSAAEEEMAKGGPVDPALQNKVNLYTELVVLLQKEKQLKQDIDQKIGAAQADITQKSIEKKQVEVKLEERKKKLGEESNNVSRKILEINKMVNALKAAGINLTAEQIKQLEKLNKTQKVSIDGGDRESKGLIQRAGATFSYGLIIGQLRKVYRDTLRTVLELDKAMTEAAIVTDMNRQEAYKLLGTYQALARETGLATSQVSGIVVEFLKQGRSMSEAIELARVAAMSAKVAGIDARDAVNYLTAAVNGFQLAASQAGDIADKFAAISAASATDFNELAIAMSKVAPVAYTAGVGVDFMMGVLAKGLETTREAPENIGTAFKTIFARMREVTDIGKATEDGMSLNRVEKALESIGVPLRDVSGQFRNLEDVLIDVGDKWDTLTTIEQAYIATSLAGTRQQPRLLAIFNDFARTKELIQLSSDATGQLAFQHMEYMEGAEAALAQLKTAWEGFVMSFTDNELVILGIELLTVAVNTLTGAFNFLGGSTFKMIAGIALVSLMYAKQIPALAMNTKLAILRNAVASKQIILTVKQQAKMNTLITQYATANFMEKQKILTDMQSIATTNAKNRANMKLGATLKVNAKIMLAQMLAALPMIAIFAAVAAAAALLYMHFTSMTFSVDNMTKAMRKNNKELSELSDKEKNVRKLATEFEKLDKKVGKTTQDLERMKTIAKELETLEIDNQEFNITRTDLRGEIVFNDVEFNRYIKYIETKREFLIKQNMGLFQQAVAKDLEKALTDPTIVAFWSDFAYDLGIDFIKSLGKGISDNVEESLTEAARKLSNTLSPANFLSEQTIFKTDLDITFQQATRDLFKGLTFQTKEEFEDYVQVLQNGGKLTNDELLKLNDYINNFGTRFDFLFVKLGFDPIKALLPNEGAIDEYQQTILNILEDVYTNAESQISELTSEGINKTADIFQISADAYRDARTEIEGLDVAPEVREQTIKFLGETMSDEAILYDLIYNKEIAVAVIAKMSVDLDMTAIQEVYKKFEEVFAKIAKDPSANGIKEIMQSANVDAILGNLFANTETGVRSGFAQLNSMLRTLTSTGRMTLEEANRFVIELSNNIQALSTDQVASLLKDQMELSKKLFTLPEQIAKGDFTNFAELVEIYGIEGTRAIFSGNTKVLTQFFDAQNKKVTDQIKESIALIEETTKSRKIFGTLTPEQIKANERQLEALGLMLQYYETLATAEQLRNYRLAEAKDILKEMNDLLSLQEKLLNLGINAPFLQTIEEMVNSYYTSGIGFLTTQLTADLKMLESLEDDNGFFDPDKDTYGMVEASIEKAMETFTQLIDAVTAAYNTQKKAVEERYKAEITAIKDSHSDRWSQIDFTNKLAEAEEKIVEARRALMGFAISGVSRGTLEQAQKDLKKLQEERQKIIEQQMIDEATEQLDRQMQDELIEVQRSLTSVLGDLILEMQGLSDVFTLTTDPNYIPGVTPVLPGLTGLGTDPAQTAVDNLTDSNNGLIAVNTTLIDAILALTHRLGNDKTTNTGHGGGAFRGEIKEFDITAAVGIVRM